MLTRRDLLKRGSLVGMAALATPALLTLEGCPISQSQLVALIGELQSGFNAILPYLKTVDAATAAKVQALLTDLQSDVATWTSGSSIAIIEQIVNDIVAALALFPVTAAYAPLIALIVATAEGIITLLVPNSAPAPAPAPAGIRAMARARYPHPPKTAGGFRKEWNRVAESETRTDLELQ